MPDDVRLTPHEGEDEMKDQRTTEWISRYVAHWRSRGFVNDDNYVRMSAEAWLESNPSDIDEKPEEVADDCFEEEMEQARQSIDS